jgi:hypothetical protein
MGIEEKVDLIVKEMTRDELLLFFHLSDRFINDFHLRRQGRQILLSRYTQEIELPLEDCIIREPEFFMNEGIEFGVPLALEKNTIRSVRLRLGV